MNRLKKKAWGDFSRICITMILLMLGFGLILFLNIEGGVISLFSTLSSCGLIVAITLFAKLRAKEEDVQGFLQFDEREFHLFRKSQEWGHYCFVAFMSVAMMVTFSTVGSRGMIPVWSLPFILLSGGFLSEAVRFVILMNYAKDDNENSEGGAV